MKTIISKWINSSCKANVFAGVKPESTPVSKPTKPESMPIAEPVEPESTTVTDPAKPESTPVTVPAEPESMPVTGRIHTKHNQNHDNTRVHLTQQG